MISHRQTLLENERLDNDQSLDTKEKLVSEFVKTVSDIEFKSCDEIENNLQKIIYRTRGLIHKELNRRRK